MDSTAPPAPATNRLLLAAQGYAELGMIDEAFAELDALSPPATAARQERRAEVLHLRVQLLFQTRRWESALEVCRRLCELEPEAPQPFIHAAFCLHELGRTAEARTLLLHGPAALKREATYYYNLGCYDTALNDLVSAENHLRASFQMDKKLRDFARTDPDLVRMRHLL
ncbi:MAG: hypothetical protein JO117_11750 [Verrucomicrobia bacterium]|nr:hypothetical protein [Verrucomicrobiota bacterium]